MPTYLIRKALLSLLLLVTPPEELKLMKAAQKKRTSETAGPESDGEGEPAEVGDIDMIGAAL